MKWKRLLSLTLTLGMLTGLLPPPAMAAGADGKVQVALLEENSPEISFWLEEGVPYYQIDFHGETLVEPSKLGLETSLGPLKDQFTMGEVTYTSGDETWEPVVGEQSQFRDYYQQASIPLTTGDVSITLELRAYETGVAIRYLLPQSEEDYEITDEYTQFVFPAGTVASVHQGGNQTVPKQVAVESFADVTYMRPMTLQYQSGAAMTICEANLDNYGVMTLTKDPTAQRALKAEYVSYKPSRPAGSPAQGPEITVSGGSPSATPWRTFVIGSSDIELPANSSLVLNLNEAPDEETYHFSEWVEPGSCLRAASGMNNDAIKAIVDQAQAKGIKYVLLDTGWYGPEYDVNCDPRLDPTLLDPDNPSDKILLEQYFAREGEETFLPNGEGVFNTRGKGFDVYKDLGTPGTFQTNVDIPAICDYANQKDVGIILYVNGVYLPDSSGRDRFGAEEIFAKFESWGVKGVKPGFVHVRAQQFESYMQEVVEAAARHHLIMTVHDEYVPTGLERTFPNLFCTEGILGDEGIGKETPQVAEDIATLFTRTIQGPTDHTFCWPGKATKAYALASPLMFRTGMSVLYWYTNPNSVPEQDKDKMGFWQDFPGTWDESLYLEGSMYEYATYARRSGETWYVGSLSAVDRTLEVPLDFLDPDTVYVADIYADGADADPMAGWNSGAKAKQTLENEQYLVTSETVLKRELKYGFGYAVKLTKATAEEIESLQPYSAALEILKGRMVKYEAYQESDYTTDSWAVLAQAMEEAQAVVNAPDQYTEEQIEALVVRLDAAAAGLVNFASLKEVLAQAERLTWYHYTPESWAVLEQAVSDAEGLLEGPFSQAQMEKAAAAVRSAMEGLVKDPDAVLEKTTYLSDISYTSESWSVNEGQQGQIKKDKNRANGTLALMVDGVKTEFPKGMGLDAPGELYYNIAGMGYEIFEGYVGVDANKPDMGSIIFRVYGDGELLYESECAQTGKAEAQHFSIPVAGVEMLRLESDMVENRNGDWADWADAKFLTYKDPNASLTGIAVNGAPLFEFHKDTTTYFYPVKEGDPIPEVTVTCAASASAQVEQAQALPGTATITVTRGDGSQAVYTVEFRYTSVAGYLSDLPNSAIVRNSLHYGTVFRDVSCKNDPIAMTDADGVSELKFEKGLGTHASSSTDSTVVFDIAGKGYQRFEGYVGIRYATHEEEINGASSSGKPRSSVIFRVYVDNETVPRFESSKMESRTPAEFFSIDVTDAKTLRLELDACGDQSADHANWGDAKFLTYEEPAPETYGVTVHVQGQGEASANATEAAEGDSVTLTQKAAEGWHFVEWMSDDVDVAEDNTFTMPGHAVTVTAVFEQDEHVHTLTKTEAKEATCTKDGNIAYWYCEGCRKYFSDEEGSVKITQEETVVKALGHEFAAEWSKDETGHWHQCIRCDEIDEVQAHTPDREAPTETEPQVCTVCGYVIASETGHITHTPGDEWSCDENQHWHKCTGCEEKLEVEDHSGGTATCTEQAVCEVCGQPYGALKAHSYTEWKFDDTQHWKVCADCAAEEPESRTDHDWTLESESETERHYTCVCGAAKTVEIPLNVTFEYNNGSEPVTVQVDKGQTVARPTDPTNGDFDFDGWYTDPACTQPYDFNTPVTTGFTLYAGWKMVGPSIDHDDDKEEPKEPEDPEEPEEPDIEEPETPLNPTPGFTDVADNFWGKEAIDYVAAEGLMNGTSETTFAPNVTTTRVMLMTILARMDGVDTSNSNPWYQKGMEWAVSEGVSDGTNPEGSITREQLAVMLYRYSGSPAVSADALTFADGDAVSEWAVDGVRWAVANGILSGKGNNTLDPQGNATRAEVAQMLYNFSKIG